MKNAANNGARTVEKTVMRTLTAMPVATRPRRKQTGAMKIAIGANGRIEVIAETPHATKIAIEQPTAVMAVAKHSAILLAPTIETIASNGLTPVPKHRMTAALVKTNEPVVMIVTAEAIETAEATEIVEMTETRAIMAARIGTIAAIKIKQAGATETMIGIGVTTVMVVAIRETAIGTMAIGMAAAADMTATAHGVMDMTMQNTATAITAIGAKPIRATITAAMTGVGTIMTGTTIITSISISHTNHGADGIGTAAIATLVEAVGRQAIPAMTAPTSCFMTARAIAAMPLASRIR